MVTHLAQVAAFATNHLRVIKDSDGEVTASSVSRVEGEERVAELARMLSGLPDSDSGLEHARELIEGRAPTPGGRARGTRRGSRRPAGSVPRRGGDSLRAARSGLG